MKILTVCTQCQMMQPTIVDYYDDGVAYVTCSKGHNTAHLVKSAKFEILLESGATALLDGFTFEACASLSAALGRFYEFELQVMCRARGISKEVYVEMFKGMSIQSERQLGAFMVLYVIEFGEPYKPDRKITEIRNSVIHKGKIPTRKDANDFMSSVYSVIVSLYHKLHAKHFDDVMMVIGEDLLEDKPRYRRICRFRQTPVLFFSTF